MDISKIVADFKSNISQAEDHYRQEAGKLRTGQAHPSMLDGLMIEAYGVTMPLIQVGSVSVPEPTQLMVTPFDPSNIESISAAIRADKRLDLNPQDDGRVVRIQLPPLTTERRQQLAKALRSQQEDAFISCRNSRHEALKQLKELDGASEDEVKRAESEIDDIMAASKSKLEEFTKVKESEILAV